MASFTGIKNSTTSTFYYGAKYGYSGNNNTFIGYKAGMTDVSTELKEQKLKEQEEGMEAPRLPRLGKKKASRKVSNFKKDPVLKLIASRYFVKPQFLWLVNREKLPYPETALKSISRDYGVGKYTYDPINDTTEIESDKLNHSVPTAHNWYEVLISDCLEHCDNYMTRANVLKFALSCLCASPYRRITLIVPEKGDLGKQDLMGLAYFARADRVWEPDAAKEMKGRVCIAFK